MRIGIDVRYLSHGLVGGIHTYEKHLVPALAELASEHAIFLYADTKRPFELAGLPPNVTVRMLPWRSPLSTIQHDLFMSRAMQRDRLDIAHYPANYGFRVPGARTVVTLHDALTIMPLRETLFSSGSRFTARRTAMTIYLYLCSRMALRHADMLLTVSEHARQDILRYCSFSPDRIVAVPHAPTPDLRRVDDPATLAEVRDRHALTHPFVLADGLKNPGVIVRAWRRLPEEIQRTHQIVFFSRRPDPLPIVHEAVAAGHARLLINPSRADLVALFSMAEIFVFPSWFEGFGIPILEAMTCGAPVIASDRTSIPEVCGNAALIIDAEDDQQLAGHLRTVLTSSAEHARLQQLGYQRAAQFSWRKSARMVLDCYGSLASAPGAARMAVSSDDH
jgi:glycosyltransferase involved in cell wall biosynthesis